ncbi:hypothetical protein VNO80_25757 [Phaseolus coccineus]|uniref:Uncharacterized protein n=1 Tax=Phaseolus coccineus TaxID=3886 RepID=A0AAN9QQE0_PHACN
MLPSSKQTASLLYVRLSKGQLPISIRLGNDSNPGQPCIVRVCRFDGKPPSGNDSSLGQYSIVSSFKFDGKPPSGNDLSLGQYPIVSTSRFDGKPLSWND